MVDPASPAGPTTFGALLRDYRVDAGLTQAALAEQAGLSVRGIQHLEAGDARPYRHTAARLAQVLRLAPGQREAFLAAAAPLPRQRAGTLTSKASEAPAAPRPREVVPASRRIDPPSAPREPTGTLTSSVSDPASARRRADAPSSAATDQWLQPSAARDQPPPPRLGGERKTVTVVCVEIVGLSALAGRLEGERAQAALDECFELIASEVAHYDGTVHERTDTGVVALFGAPLTEEDHAVRALHAALAIQDALEGYGARAQRRWGVAPRPRLGVATGTVIVEARGDTLRLDEAGERPPLALARRLQQQAAPGAISVGERAYRAAREVFAWRALGSPTRDAAAAPVAAYALAEPVAAYELVGPGAARSRFDALLERGLTRLVGRDREVAQLEAAWEQARGGHGQVVSLVGEAGIGKSRLVHEFKQRLAAEAAPCWEGSCFAYGGAISYLPFLEIVKAFFSLEGTASELETKERIARRLDALPLDAAAVAPYVHNLLALAVDEALFARLPSHVVRQRTVEALRALSLAAARCQPLVLVLEDVHWIDKASEELLAALVEALADAPILLVLLYRPEYVHAWANRAYHARIALNRLPAPSSAAMVRAILAKPYATRLSLERLEPRHSQTMVQELLGTEAIPRELEEVVARKTEGNPFFVEELTRSLVESGDLVRQNGSYTLARPLADLELPPTVQGVLLARIDRLNEELKAVLQVAAVIGRVFGHSLLAAVAPHEGTLDELLLQLEDLEFVYVTSLAPEREYSFKHVLTQEVVYQTLLQPQREQYHERIGQALEALYPDRLEEYYELLAYYYARSANADKAVTYLDLASQKAARANAMAEAKGYFDQAMALLDGLPDTSANRERRIRLIVHQFLVFWLLQQVPEYHAHLTRYEAVAIGLQDPGLLGLYYKHLGHCEWVFGHLDRALETTTRAVALSESAGEPESTGMAYCILQWCHLVLGNYGEVFRFEERGLAALQQQFNLRYYLWTLTAAAWAYASLGRWEEAIAEGARALRVGEEYDDRSVISFASFIISVAETYQGDLTRALEHGTRALECAPTPADKVWAQSALAWTWCRAGEPARGVATLAALVPLYGTTRFVFGEIFGGLYLGEGYWLAGEPERARQALEAVIALAEPRGIRFHVGRARRLLGEIALPEDAAAALGHFEASIAVLATIEAENELALAYAGCGRAHAQQGDAARARDYLDRALAIFTRLGTLLEPERVRQALAVL